MEGVGQVFFAADWDGADHRQASLTPLQALNSWDVRRGDSQPRLALDGLRMLWAPSQQIFGGLRVPPACGHGLATHWHYWSGSQDRREPGPRFMTKSS